MQIASIGIVGHGAFGTLLETLSKRFAPDITLRIHSKDKAADGVRFFSLEETCQSDVLVFAVPISNFEEALRDAVQFARQDAVLVDISTVKMHTAALLAAHADGRPYIAAHPMWGPESYEKKGGDVSGFRIIVTEEKLPDDAKEMFRTFLKRLGFVVVTMTSEEHDKQLAETLFLTHFVGQTVARAGFVRTDIDTVSFGYLMEAVEIVKNDTALFQNVFRFNPFCKETLDRFEASEQDVRALLEKGSA